MQPRTNCDRRQRSRVTQADCFEVLPRLEASTIDAVITDPPYGLNFMGRAWDRPMVGPAPQAGRRPASDQGHETGHRNPGGYEHDLQEWHEVWARAALRVLRPGGHLLAFGSPRTFHRLTCALEDAGFEIRDCLCWLHSQGFPKSLDVSKALDAAAGAKRAVIGRRHDGVGNTEASIHRSEGWAKARTSSFDVTAPSTPQAQYWDGWGTGLKPAWEPIVLARKPLEGSVARNVLAHDTGALNIDASRTCAPRCGRWPANLLLSHTSDCRQVGRDSSSERRSEAEEPRGRSTAGWRGLDAGTGTGEGAAWECLPTCPVAELDAQSTSTPTRDRTIADSPNADTRAPVLAGASRFFYCAKPSRRERNDGLRNAGASALANNHATVKPIALMRYLVRLITPPGGLVLDPFAGSGTTGIAATLEGARFHGIEREAEYAQVARVRIKHWAPRRPQCRAVRPPAKASARR